MISLFRCAFVLQSLDADKVFYGGNPIDLHPDPDNHYPGFSAAASSFYPSQCSVTSPPSWCNLNVFVGYARSHAVFGGMPMVRLLSCIDVSDMAGNGKCIVDHDHHDGI